MYETVVGYVMAILGLALILLSMVLLSTKGRGDKVITWRGFGVVFEIKPCRDCASRRKIIKEC